VWVPRRIRSARAGAVLQPPRGSDGEEVPAEEEVTAAGAGGAHAPEVTALPQVAFLIARNAAF